jgi:hypothetical protein
MPLTYKGIIIFAAGYRNIPILLLFRQLPITDIIAAVSRGGRVL